MYQSKPRFAGGTCDRVGQEGGGEAGLDRAEEEQQPPGAEGRMGIMTIQWTARRRSSSSPLGPRGAWV